MIKSSKTRFLALTLGRTGSTLLKTIINNLSDTKCEDEIFYNKTEKPIDFATIRAAESKEKTYGFKVKSSQIEESLMEPKEFLDQLYADGWKIIHLERDNVLKMVISYLYARDSGSFFHYKSKLAFIKRHPKVRIDLNELIKIMDDNIDFKSRDKQLLSGYDHLHLSYEDDLEKPGQHIQCLQKVATFLQHEPFAEELNTPLEKSIPHPSKRIANWNEIETALEQSTYAQFLD